MFSGYEEYTIWGRSVFRLSNRGQMLKTLKIIIAGLELKGGAAFPSFRDAFFARTRYAPGNPFSWISFWAICS